MPKVESSLNNINTQRGKGCTIPLPKWNKLNRLYKKNSQAEEEEEEEEACCILL